MSTWLKVLLFVVLGLAVIVLVLAYGTRFFMRKMFGYREGPLTAADREMLIRYYELRAEGRDDEEIFKEFVDSEQSFKDFVRNKTESHATKRILTAAFGALESAEAIAVLRAAGDPPPAEPPPEMLERMRELDRSGRPADAFLLAYYGTGMDMQSITELIREEIGVKKDSVRDLVAIPIREWRRRPRRTTRP